MGHLVPTSTTTQLVSLAFDYNDVENKKWGRRKVIQAQELKGRGQNSLFESLIALSGIGTWRGFDSI
jgi:hypothetical protein